MTLPDSSPRVDTPPATADRAELLRRAAQAMLRGRAFEVKVTSLYRAGKIIGGVYTGKGQEAFSAAQAVHLHPGDVYAPLIRDAAGRIAFGEPLLDAMRTYLGSVQGPMRGRDGNIHRGRPTEGLLAMISHLGASLSVVNGVLLARRLQGRGGVGAATFGDGATSTGAFHEALNQAAVMKLPVVVAVANNRYAYSTPNESQFACAHLLDRARGYGVGGHEVREGNSLVQSVAGFSAAFAAARRGEGPQLVVGEMLRLSGHGEHDDARYVKAELREGSLGRDCLEVTRAELEQEGIADSAQWHAWEAAAAEEMQDLQARVAPEPGPDPYLDSWRALASTYEA